ncbi:Uncharacterised protein [Raoultella ornithinolytica]|nr:Uncharacterised protein [Raoultella ornithinolytica]
MQEMQGNAGNAGKCREERDAAKAIPPHGVRRERNLFQFQLVHCRDAETAIDVNDFTGDTGRQVGAQEGCAVTHVFDSHGTAESG